MPSLDALLLEEIVAGLIFAALTVYALSGGADFGGGVWDLLAIGPRRNAQRETIARALAPIWEANHVWLIFVIVMLFIAFPRAFAVISTALNIPLSLALVGIIARSSAFVFRTYGGPQGHYHRRWSLTFAIASVVTPVMLGIIVGALTSGTIRVDPASGAVLSGFFAGWLAPFPLAIGGFALVLFAFLAAVYLTLETDDPELREDFRRRALGAAVALGAMALVSYLLAEGGAPRIRYGLSWQWWSLPFHGLTGLAAVGAITALWRRRYPLARVLAIVQATLILWGWGLAQFPYLVLPDLTVVNTAAPPQVLRLLLVLTGLGMVVLVPSLWLLYRIFKGRRRNEAPLAPAGPSAQDDPEA
jgi:cytochrome d ubiquinol oxidase subunit II